MAHFYSDCLAGSANQSWFSPDRANELLTSRSYYRLFAGGKQPYALLFTGTTDSTFADGDHSRANDLLDYTIHSVEVGLCDVCTMEEAAEPDAFTALAFDGAAEKHITAGMAVFTDPVTLCAQAGQYLCVETTFSGSRIPCHPEIKIPAFHMENGRWTPSVFQPFPGMIGCSRPVKAHVGFFGDSITQGIGTPHNSYTHWNAVLARKLGTAYAYWNIGIGYARASDAASDGMWLKKASQLQAVTVCFGVNDLLRGATADQVVGNLRIIVTALKARGVRVLLQSIPPFDMTGSAAQNWLEANERVRKELFPLADAAFDAAELLKKSDREMLMAKFGGHPDAQGCALWAEGLAPVMRKFLQTI